VQCDHLEGLTGHLHRALNREVALLNPSFEFSLRGKIPAQYDMKEIEGSR
jgi:hypothetical protein